ncbi:MAG TPA: hypothetical protein VGM82_24670 [Gemmatimonadaceae bacterium]|jgi:hypothetical protein
MSSLDLTVLLDFALAAMAIIMLLVLVLPPALWRRVKASLRLGS